MMGFRVMWEHTIVARRTFLHNVALERIIYSIFQTYQMWFALVYTFFIVKGISLAFDTKTADHRKAISQSSAAP